MAHKQMQARCLNTAHMANFGSATSATWFEGIPIDIGSANVGRQRGDHESKNRSSPPPLSTLDAKIRLKMKIAKLKQNRMKKHDE